MNNQFCQGMRKTSSIGPFETFSKSTTTEVDKRQAVARRSIEDIMEQRRIEQEFAL